MITTRRNLLTIAVLCLFASLIFTACDKDEIIDQDKDIEKDDDINTDSPFIEGLSLDNYPIIDGSTSTLPLNTVIACELMGIEYEWNNNLIDFNKNRWSMDPSIKGDQKLKFDDRVRSSQTHNSLINVIDNEVDMALSARTMSPDEKAYAESKGVTLIETPIALDAFIFIVNARNPVEGLTTQNIQDIYTGKVTTWKNLGVVNGPKPGLTVSILPLVRNANSGSQELMDQLIMKDLQYLDLPIYEEALVLTMAGMLDAIGGYPMGIGYTVYYYNEFIIRPEDKYIKLVALDGVKPSTETISDRTYPYATEVYAVIRSDIDKSSMAYKVYEWLQTEAGIKAISNSGYIPSAFCGGGLTS